MKKNERTNDSEHENFINASLRVRCCLSLVGVCLGRWPKFMSRELNFISDYRLLTFSRASFCCCAAVRFIVQLWRTSTNIFNYSLFFSSNPIHRMSHHNIPILPVFALTFAPFLPHLNPSFISFSNFPLFYVRTPLLMVGKRTKRGSEEEK